ncbi:MAG: hypothetical protein Q4P25_02005 [Tissierellia bacterium]|nr:hypothetical protein [Tissierellia bacterium]
MSLFLGHIHYLMFDKIKFQEQLINKLLHFTSQREELENELDALGAIEEGSLEEIIDPSNIHGWLQERVIRSERRLALVCQQLITEGQSEKILQTGYQVGEELDFSGNAAEAYTIMTQHFLDGMPCDGALRPLVLEDDEVVLQVITDLHRQYWKESTISLYWELRSQFMKGLLKNTKYQWIEKDHPIYEIR